MEEDREGSDPLDRKGGIGLTLAEALVQRVRAKLVLAGRSPLPPREEWSAGMVEGDEVAQILAKLRRMEVSGGERS